jgi:hypothetical protein
MAIKSNMITGLSWYAKILGDAPPGYEDGPAEWVLDLILDEKAKNAYLESKGDPFYVKVNKDTGKEYIRFVRKETKKDGSKANPIEVVGPDGKPWDQKVKIGNDSELNVKYCLNEITHKGAKRLKPYLLGVQVWEHQPYDDTGKFPTKAAGSDAPEAKEDW